MAIAAGTLALSALEGCSSVQRTTAPEKGQVMNQIDYRRSPIAYSTPGNQTGHELRRVTEQDTQYALEGIVIHGKAMYEQENVLKKPGEFQSYFVLQEDRHLVLDSLNHVVGETSEFIYIPTIVNNKSNQPASKITLRTDGLYGVRANMTEYPTEGVETGTFHETQNDARHNIRTITIGTNILEEPMEWYVPRVEEGGESPNALSFYMMQVDGTTKDIAPNGKIMLISTSGILRPMKISRETYNKRPSTPEPVLPIAPEDNTGQGTESPK